MAFSVSLWRDYLLFYVIVIVNHCPSSYIRRIVSNLVSFYLSKTADWQSKARVFNKFIDERTFQNLCS